MNTQRTYSVKTDVQSADLERWHKYGWSIEYMQFMENGKLNVVAYKDEVPLPSAPAQPAAKRIATGTMPIVVFNPPTRIFSNNPQRASVQAQRDQDKAELFDIMQGYIKSRDDIDRDFKPFKLGVQQ